MRIIHKGGGVARHPRRPTLTAPVDETELPAFLGRAERRIFTCAARRSDAGLPRRGPVRGRDSGAVL